jgi:oligopeptide/dipeptide ABC transporter ATP-binding protein
MNQDNTLLHVEDLVLYFKTHRGMVQAVDHVSFDLPKNKAVVILGESGCGKSSMAKAILRLLPRNVGVYEGKVVIDDLDVMSLTDEAFRRQVRWVKMSMVPQAAMNSLNPVLRAGDQVAEPAMIHLGMSREEALELAREMFIRVGVPVDFLARYPFELSGGMRQRVAIAMALITKPQLIILDEPTSALDLLTQANIMNVLKTIKWETGTSYILITHDIATSSELADEVAVMYAGQIVEVNEAERFFSQPLHPYSQKLMASVPRLYGDEEPDFIPGRPPSLLHPPTGCRFADRCHLRFDKCDVEPPTFIVDGHPVKCWLYEAEATETRFSKAQVQEQQSA